MTNLRNSANPQTTILGNKYVVTDNFQDYSREP